MHSHVTRAIAFGAILCACLLSRTPARARTLPTIEARPNDPSDSASCYKWFPVGAARPGLERVCSGTYPVDFAVPVDTPGTKSIIVQGTRASSNAQLSCQAIAVTNSGGYAFGRVVYLTTLPSDQFQLMQLPDIDVDWGGTLWVRCMMGYGTRLLGIDLINP